MKRVFVAVLAVGSLGCSPMVWDKSGASKQDYLIESNACEIEARQKSNYGGSFGGEMVRLEAYKKCMTTRGYALRP